MTRIPPVSVPLAQLVLLSLWLGGAVLFASAVAPAAFAVLPSRTLAGAIVGRVLPIVFWSGMIVGLIVLALDSVIRHGRSWGARDLAIPAMMAACAVAQFVIAPRIERVREQIGVPMEQLAMDDARRVAFGRLHAASVAWMGVAMLAAAIAIVIAWRTAQQRS